MKRRQFLVIGLGRFGASLATALGEKGAEVMGIDSREDAVGDVADRITHSLVADSTEERVLQEVGVDHFDVCICAVGSDLEASLMTTLLLKEFGAKRLVAKASTSLHGRVLERIGADRVIYPERDVALRLALDLTASADSLSVVVPLSVRHAMFEVKAPQRFSGFTLAELHLRRDHGITVVAIRRGDDIVVSPAAEEVVRHDDILLVVGDRARAEKALREAG